MKSKPILFTTLLLLSCLWAAPSRVQAQGLDCSCLQNLPVLSTNACQAVIPDICSLIASCYQNPAVPPSNLSCSQFPSPGTPVGPGVHTINISVLEPDGTAHYCTLFFTVNPLPACSFTLLCATNKTVECGTAWTFDPPAWTNNCAPPPGTVSNGVTVTVISTVTNGFCPQTITQTWEAVDDCRHTNWCSQTVTVVDSIPPQLNPACITNNAAWPFSMIVYGCKADIPDFCQAARACAQDLCGVTKCTQSPAAGTSVGVGVHPVTITVFDCAGNPASVVVNFTVAGSFMTNIWNTGMGGPAGNIPLPPGTADTNFLLVSMPPGGCTGPAQVLSPGTIPGVWVPNGPASQWIGASLSSSCQGGVYHYRLRFDLPCEGAKITGLWSSDDSSAVYLNGQPTGWTIPSTQNPNLPLYQWFPITLTNGFVCGPNFLDFYVTNASFGVNPTGFRAQLTNLVDTCNCTCTNCIVILNCPTNQVVTTCNSNAVVTFPQPSAYSTCGVAITNVTFLPPSGSTFPLGTNPVVCTVTDALGNTASCTFTVTVAQGVNCCTVVPVLRLFSGATNSPPGVLPGGAWDTKFQTGPPMFPAPNPMVHLFAIGSWVPNSALSKWIGRSANNGNVPGGVYWYTNRFFLCSTNQASVTGRWSADDTGGIYLNGAHTGNVLPPSWAFLNWTPVSINSGFLPGWNTLVFAVTNGGTTPSGLRTEITGSACCNSCVSIACPQNITTTTCAGGAVVNFPAPSASSACGNIVSITFSPPSGSFFPVGTNTVTATAVDSQGNAATCSFKVTVVSTAVPVSITCPKSQTIYTCKTTAVAYYAATATGNTGPITYVPPSGSVFPLGTNTVTCIATNSCGQAVSCTFQVIVKPILTGPPSMTLTAGLPDNFVPPTEAASTNACLLASVNNYPLWKPFDATPINRLFGHRFSGLPNNIVQAQLVTRMRAEGVVVGVGQGSDNDGLFITLTNCAANAWSYVASIKTLPGAGGTWFSTQPPITVTNTLSAAQVAHLNATQRLDVMVHDDTTVDYLQLRLWLCPPSINPHIGVAHLGLKNSPSPSSIAVLPGIELPGFGPIGRGSALAVAPSDGDPATPNGVQLYPGGSKAFAFTTVLDMNAPEGARITVAVPVEDGPSAPLLELVKSCRPPCGWNIKVNKRFFDEGGPACRVSGVDANGDLLGSFMMNLDEALAEPLLTLTPEDGIGQFPVSFLLDSVSGEISITYPGAAARRLCNGLPCPRGWDGTIKGRIDEAARRKGWDGTVKCPCYDAETSRIVITPTGGPGVPPRPALELASEGLPELLIADERLYLFGGREVAVLDEAYVMLNGTDQGDGISFVADEDYSGISIDLGRSESFDIGLHSFPPDDGSPSEQLLRIGGPRWPLALTNRPPPPPIEARVANSPRGIEFSLDYSAWLAQNITLEMFLNGASVGSRVIPGSVIGGPTPLPLGPNTPERVGFQAIKGILTLFSSEPFQIDGQAADELRFTPELTPDSPPSEFASSLEIRSTAGVITTVHSLQRALACAPAALSVTSDAASGGTVFSWEGDGYRLLGAETLDGPWIDLGSTSPVVLPATAPQRYFRLACE